MKVLITGINGFTGIHLERYLAQQGFDVYGTTLRKPKNKKHYQCDVTNKNQLKSIILDIQPDYVIHMAGISFVGESNATLIYNVNVIGAENVLAVLAEHNINVKKIILVSTSLVYGNQGKEVLDESLCPKPVNHYGTSKIAMEYLASNYFKKLNIIITRPFNYTGIGQAEHFLIPKIVHHFKEGKKEIALGNTHVAREFNDIHYVVDIYYRLLLCDAKSEIVNLSSNNPIRLLDVIDMMQEIAGYQIEIKVNPTFVRANEIKSLAGSTKRLEQIIDLPKAYTLKKTLVEMYET